MKFVHLLSISLVVLSSLINGAEAQSPTSPPAIEKQVTAAAASRSKVVVVQPIILCDDDGTHAARWALPLKRVNRVYTRADLEFLYLAPIRWNHSKARQGKINLNAIVTQGRAKGIISKDPAVLSLLFVSAVDGNPGPLGRGMMRGNICFVTLGPEGKMTDPAKRAFVVAHEVGHCFGLKHVVDDPAVPNDVPNLEGEGPFEKRLAVEGLHPTQAATVKTSPLCQPRIHFHTQNESARLLTHDAWNNRPEKLRDDDVRFQLGLAPDTEIPTDPTARVNFIRKHFAASALAFTPEEMSILRMRVARLRHLLESSPIFGGKKSLLTRLPWNFIKVKSSFCQSYPHTRGLAIVLTAPVIAMLAENETRALTLLLHEKMHIVQRLSLARLSPSYRRYGFIPAPLADGESARLHLVTNPDAPAPRWAIRLGTQSYLIASSLTNRDGDYQFTERCYPLKLTKRGHVALPPITDPPSIIAWRKKFPIPTGYDDPREVQAYLLTRIFNIDLLHKPTNHLTPAQKKNLDEERKNLPSILSMRSQ